MGGGGNELKEGGLAGQEGEGLELRAPNVIVSSSLLKEPLNSSSDTRLLCSPTDTLGWKRGRFSVNYDWNEPLAVEIHFACTAYEVSGGIYNLDTGEKLCCGEYLVPVALICPCPCPTCMCYANMPAPVVGLLSNHMCSHTFWNNCTCT